MAETFAYDLVGFLRVLYRRRGMIITGTIGVTVLVAVASLIWPQTWRADARVFVSTPKYKETLRLVSKPFDVLTYQDVMASDPVYIQIIGTLKWYRTAVHSLYRNEAYLQKIRAHLEEKAEGKTPFELIQNTNTEILREFLVPPGEKDDPMWKNRMSMLGNLSAEELAIVYGMDEDELEDLTVFDLRKMLSTSVAKVRETNMEVEYSRVIRVSAEFDTAAGAKMAVNTWLDLFMARAEEKVKNTIEYEIQLKRNRAKTLQINLATAETKLASYEQSANLGQLRAELASKLVLLTGMTPNRRIANQVDEAFNLDDEDPWFMKERHQQTDLLSFAISPQYDDALLPSRLKIEGELNVVEAMLKTQEEENNSTPGMLEHKAELEAKLSSLKSAIKTVSQEISTLWKTIRNHETLIAQLQRKVNNEQSALAALQPLLDEAAVLESQGENVRYADASIDRAIKPDKRVFPKRSMMTAAGMVLSFFLWCCMAFFLDIWQEVIKPDDEPEIATGASGE